MSHTILSRATNAISVARGYVVDRSDYIIDGNRIVFRFGFGGVARDGDRAYAAATRALAAWTAALVDEGLVTTPGRGVEFSTDGWYIQISVDCVPSVDARIAAAGRRARAAQIKDCEADGCTADRCADRAQADAERDMHNHLTR